jgi:hypothetical protein
MTLSTLNEVDPLEWRDLKHLEAQLIARFCPPLAPEEVQACLIDCVARFETARVRQYVPLLIERDARQRLGDLSRARMIGVVQ